MTQFDQDIQIVIKNDLPNCVLTFYHRMMQYLIEEDYKSIFNMNEILAQKQSLQSLGKDYDKYVVPFIFIIMANACFDIKKYEDAIRILNTALLVQEKALGKKHPLVGVTLNNLAVVYAKEGKYEEVKNLAYRALDIYDQDTCLEYSFVAEKLRKLARYFNNQDKYKEEKRCYIRALEICEAKQNSDDSSVAVATNELAQYYLKRGKLKDAEEHFKKVLSRACEKEFGDAGDKSTWLKKLDPKRILKIANEDNGSGTNIWQIAEERERNKRKVSEEASPPIWYKPASFYAPTFGAALSGLEAVYKKQGKHVAAKILNYYANQQPVEIPVIIKEVHEVQNPNDPSRPSIPTSDTSNQVSAPQEVPPQLPPKKRDIIPDSKTPSSPPDRWSVCQIDVMVYPPPPPLPIRGCGPSPTVPQKNIPTMSSSPPLPLPSTSSLPAAEEEDSSCEAISQRFMVLPSAPPAEDDEFVLGPLEVPEQTRFLERIAQLQAELAEKDQRLAAVERTIETHEGFHKICLDDVETGSGVAAITSELTENSRNVSYVKKRTAAMAE